MQNLTYRFTAPLWIYQGKGAWHFVTLPKEAADEIRFFNVSAKGFMPISVSATIGATTWKTSVFPDSKSGSYLLAIKAGVRKAERLSNGQSIDVEVKVKSEI
jgi:Domain of unknown function (DUF1905)